jgi:hypothetical protein
MLRQLMECRCPLPLSFGTWTTWSIADYLSRCTTWHIEDLERCVTMSLFELGIWDLGFGILPHLRQ